MWDANGNRRSETVNGATRSYTYDPGTHRLRTVSSRRNYSYNADGSPASDSATGWTYCYDGFGRLVMAARPDRRVSFVYNGLGQRVQKTVEYFVPDTGGVEPWRQGPRRSAASVAGVVPRDATVRSRPDVRAPAQVAQNGYWNLTNAYHYVFDEAGQLLGQYDLIGSYMQETVWLGNLPVALMRGHGLEYIHPDHLGTPRVITRVSDNAELWRWDSDPFGTTQPTTASHPTSPPLRFDLRFPGQIYDSETGLHYNGMRDYDPGTGRYLQSDPIGLAGGINTYVYVLADPIRLVDAKGLRGVPPLRPQLTYSPGIQQPGPQPIQMPLILSSSSPYSGFISRLRTVEGGIDLVSVTTGASAVFGHPSFPNSVELLMSPVAKPLFDQPLVRREAQIDLFDRPTRPGMCPR